MKEDLILEKYTRALFEVAVEQNALQDVESGLKRIEDSFSQIPELAGYLTSPQVEWKTKLGMARTLSQGLSPLIVNFVQLLMDKERQFILPGVAGEFRRLLELRARRKKAVVTTAIPLPQSEKELLEKKLREIFAEEIVLEAVEDPEIIGGLKVQIGHTILDGSIKRRLEELGKAMAKG